MKNISFFLSFLLFVDFSFGQNSIVMDSLLNVLKIESDDTSKVNIIDYISVQYNLSEPVKSLQYAEKQLQLAKKINWEKGISNAYFNIGETNYSLGNYSFALDFFKKDFEKREELHDKINTSRALTRIGAVYEEQNNYETALNYYIKALKLVEEIGDTKSIISGLCDIACIHKDIGNNDKALEYFFKSLELSEKMHNKERLAINLGNIGAVYQEKADYAKALEYDFKALEMDQKLSNKKNVASWMENIGGVYHLMSDSAYAKGNQGLVKELDLKAITYYNQSLNIFSELEDKVMQAIVLGNMGKIFTQRGKYPEAEKCLERSFAFATEMNYTDEVMNGNQRFYDLYKAMNMPVKALEYFERYVTIKDSLQEKNNNKAISELQVKYETEKKESENKELVQKNKLQTLTLTNNRYLLGGLIALLIILVTIGFLFIRQNSFKAYQQSIQLEQKLLRTQMNPHFIFNSLASIESFIYEHQPKEAGVYLSSFSKLMRLILENSSSEYITLEKEIETLNYYFALQKLRLDENLSYEIQVDESVRKEDIMLPPMLTQPFIENAIEHGFRGGKVQGIIKVIFSIIDNDLQVQVIDNGIGIEQVQNQRDLHKAYKSMAINKTKERLGFLNKAKKKKFSFSITDISSEKNGQTGTRVIFSIPLGLKSLNV